VSDGESRQQRLHRAVRAFRSNKRRATMTPRTYKITVEQMKLAAVSCCIAEKKEKLNALSSSLIHFSLSSLFYPRIIFDVNPTPKQQQQQQNKHNRRAFGKRGRIHAVHCSTRFLPLWNGPNTTPVRLGRTCKNCKSASAPTVGRT
jgi:hypothetical protein